MHRLLTAALGLLFATLSPLAAEERQFLGHGRLLTNDLLGDGKDRWRTGSVAASFVWGPEWDGALPDRIGEVLELRFNAGIIAPENVATPAAGDRPYAGVVSLGLHTHFMTGATEIALGGDLVFTGPQTGLDDLQAGLHDVFGGKDPSAATRATQIGNDINPTFVAEAGRDLRLGPNAALRPFVEARAGAETMLRVGADLGFGQVGQGGLLVRDIVTGHRYRTVSTEGAGLGIVIGGDIAHVDHSEFLPSNRGIVASDTRSRLRAGLHWQGKRGQRVFYGLTWLDQEFKGQRGEQVVGSIRINLKF